MPRNTPSNEMRHFTLEYHSGTPENELFEKLNDLYKDREVLLLKKGSWADIFSYIVLSIIIPLFYELFSNTFGVKIFLIAYGLFLIFSFIFFLGAKTYLSLHWKKSLMRDIFVTNWKIEYVEGLLKNK